MDLIEKGLDLLQQITDLLIRIMIMTVIDITALGKNSIRFVE